MPRSAVRWRIFVGVLLAIALDTATQMLWKMSADLVPDNVTLWDTLAILIHRPMFQLVGFLMICKLINWVKLLEVANLSYAKPVTSLSYVTVAIASVVILGERLHWQQVVGITVVVAGVWLVSRSEPEPAQSASTP
jgi:drug/metabolite transporter (DMT)-like permease